MKRNDTMISKEQGVALMMILWVMMLLGTIALQFAVSMRYEAQIARNFRDRTEAYYLARAGMEMAKCELMFLAKAGGTHVDSNGYVTFNAEEEDSEPFSREEPLGRGKYFYKFSTLQARLDLTTLVKNETKLEKALESFGIEPESAEMHQLLAAIKDWQDKDDLLSHPDSAEDDWYKDNTNYECKDGPFFCVDELEKIRYLREEDSDSEEEKDRKKMIIERFRDAVDEDFLMRGGKLNENFATVAALEADGKTQEEIDEILREREETGFSSKGGNPSTYNVTSIGSIKGSISSREIRAGFKIKTRNRPPELLKWTDNYLPPPIRKDNETINDKETE